jgi:lipopolysaccharide/colanic/teichoic acid biosynthesis glycosyltransferase
MIRNLSPRSAARPTTELLEGTRSRADQDSRRLPESIRRLRRSLFLKRWTDRLLGGVLVVLTLPFMLLAMALVKLTSRGPALYSQQRVGQFGRVFTIYKIRTMYHQCETVSGPKWCTPRDPRVTGIGKVLRKIHVDEFPQLWNVLKGEMSLIGPRPERPEIAGNLKFRIPDYDWRMVVLPGISGEAQIHVPPDTCLDDVRKKLKYDQQYIRKFNCWRDFKIMFQTMLKIVGLYRLDN